MHIKITLIIKIDRQIYASKLVTNFVYGEGQII